MLQSDSSKGEGKMISRISDQPQVKSSGSRLAFRSHTSDCVVSFQSLNWQLLEEEAIPKKTTEQKGDKSEQDKKTGQAWINHRGPLPLAKTNTFRLSSPYPPMNGTPLLAYVWNDHKLHVSNSVGPFFSSRFDVTHASAWKWDVDPNDLNPRKLAKIVKLGGSSSVWKKWNYPIEWDYRITPSTEVFFHVKQTKLLYMQPPVFTSQQIASLPHWGVGMAEEN